MARHTVKKGPQSDLWPVGRTYGLRTCLTVFNFAPFLFVLRLSSTLQSFDNEIIYFRQICEFTKARRSTRSSTRNDSHRRPHPASTVGPPRLIHRLDSFQSIYVSVCPWKVAETAHSDRLPLLRVWVGTECLEVPHPTLSRFLVIDRIAEKR